MQSCLFFFSLSLALSISWDSHSFNGRAAENLSNAAQYRNPKLAFLNLDTTCGHDHPMSRCQMRPMNEKLFLRKLSSRIDRCVVCIRKVGEFTIYSSNKCSLTMETEVVRMKQASEQITNERYRIAVRCAHERTTVLDSSTPEMHAAYAPRGYTQNWHLDASTA